MRKILSIDGGGIRGIIPATLIAQIERRTKKSAADLFDLIVGTSTGGILALYLSVADEDGRPRYSAKELLAIYEKRGREIFSRSFWQGMTSVGGLADEKYSDKGMETVLEDYLGDLQLQDALTNTLITAYDIHSRDTVFFQELEGRAPERINARCRQGDRGRPDLLQARQDQHAEQAGAPD